MLKIGKMRTPAEMKQLEADVRSAVAALPNLDAEQRTRVFEMAFAYVQKSHRAPHFENIAHLVRTTKPTPTGHAAFSQAAWG